LWPVRNVAARSDAYAGVGAPTESRIGRPAGWRSLDPWPNMPRIVLTEADQSNAPIEFLIGSNPGGAWRTKRYRARALAQDGVYRLRSRERAAGPTPRVTAATLVGFHTRSARSPTLPCSGGGATATMRAVSRLPWSGVGCRCPVDADPDVQPVARSALLPSQTGRCRCGLGTSRPEARQGLRPMSRNRDRTGTGPAAR